VCERERERERERDLLLGGTADIDNATCFEKVKNSQNVAGLPTNRLHDVGQREREREREGRREGERE